VPTPPLWVTSVGTMDAIAAVDPEVAAGAFLSDHATPGDMGTCA